MISAVLWQVSQEVEYQLGRMAHHASIAVFGGNNEVSCALRHRPPSLSPFVAVCEPVATKQLRRFMQTWQSIPAGWETGSLVTAAVLLERSTTCDSRGMPCTVVHWPSALAAAC